jgi:ABC-2 type transport system permease protein
MSTAAAPSTRPGVLVPLFAFYRLLLRGQISVPRLLGLGALGALSLVLGAFARSDADPAQAAADVVSSYGLALLVPLAALWLGTSAVGDLTEDRLLVYLYLKPVPRWQLPAAAVLATLSVVVPLTVLPLTLSVLVAGAGDVASATALASSLAALAYSGLFVAAGVSFRRAVWWGLAFILIWENLAAYTSDEAVRFTVFGWASSALGAAPGIDVQVEAGSVAAALVVLPAIAVVAWLAATWRYSRADVD